MKLQKLKETKGFTTGDIIIAIVIIMIFVSIITASFYNYYISTQAKIRRAIATNLLIDIIENIEAMEYNLIDETSVNALIDGFIKDGTVSNGYQLSATVQKYNETENNEDKLDLIKILEVKVQYTVGNKEETFKITRLIMK